MKIEIIYLAAGQSYEIGRGRFIRLLEAAHPIRISTRAIGSKSNRNGKLLANIGAEFPLFESALIESDEAQKITVAYSELAIYDNRLGVNGNLIFESVERAAASFNIKNYTAVPEGVLILSGEVTNRRTAIISTSQAVNVSDSVGGDQFTIDGVLEHPSSGELWAFGAGSIQVMEYLN